MPAVLFRHGHAKDETAVAMIDRETLRVLVIADDGEAVEDFRQLFASQPDQHSGDAGRKAHESRSDRRRPSLPRDFLSSRSISLSIEAYP